ncbi:MAG: hypothetical protein VB102_14270 [Paludibacter sp.]|nr:hypothetical protein [Paludibacter sp.]
MQKIIIRQLHNMITTFVYFFSAINILLALIMIFYNWKINKNVLFLSLFLIVFALESTIYSTYTYGGDITYYTFLFIISPLFFLKAPLIFLFVRGIAHDRFYLRWIDVLHLIPFLIHLSVNIPYLMTSFEDKMTISSYALANLDNFKYLNINPFYPNAWNMIARAIQLFLYVVACFVLIRLLKPRFIYLTGQLKFQYNYTVIRLKILLFMILLIVTVQNLVNYMYFNEALVKNYSDIIYFMLDLVMFVYFAIPLFVLLCPKMLYGMPHLETKHVSAYQFDNAKKGADKGK